jgi:hypothetical protein
VNYKVVTLVVTIRSISMARHGTYGKSKSFDGYGAENWAISYSNFAAFGGDHESKAMKKEREIEANVRSWDWLEQNGLAGYLRWGLIITAICGIIVAILG